MSFIITPNMLLPVPVVGSEPGPAYATDVNNALTLVDSHDHSANRGIQIQPAGINISSDLPFNGNNATQLRSVRLTPQTPPIPNSGSDVGIVYVSGNELYFNDVTGGHQVQLTLNGVVNATSSGITSGTASAAFSAGTLVVKSNSTSGANVLLQSVELTNSGNLTNILTLQAPTLSGSYSISLPSIPISKSFMALDTSGNMSASVPVNGTSLQVLQTVSGVASWQSYKAPTTSTLSGTGTYTPPAGTLYIRVEMIAAGGGGGGGGQPSAGNGTAGSNTVFGSASVQGGQPGGTGTATSIAGGGAGGTSITTGGYTVGKQSPGNAGSNGSFVHSAPVFGGGGVGGASVIGGAPNSNVNGNGVAGGSATGAGGSGGGNSNVGDIPSGGGGGSGAFLEVIIPSPTSYSYAVGTGGNGGGAGASGFVGGAGANGTIVVFEYYQ